MAGVSSHESDGPLLVPTGTSGVLGAGILAAAFSAVSGSINSVAERLKAEPVPPAMYAIHYVVKFNFTLKMIHVTKGFWTLSYCVWNLQVTSKTLINTTSLRFLPTTSLPHSKMGP